MISILSLGFDFQGLAIAIAIAIALVIFAAAVRRGSNHMSDALTQVGTALAGAMSGPFETLKADIAEAATELVALRAENAQLKLDLAAALAANAPAGTSDTDISAADAVLKAALKPATETPVTTPDNPPVQA